MTVLTILLFIILQSLAEQSNKLERARSKLGNRATWLGIVAAGLKPGKNGSGISSSIPSPMFSASFCWPLLFGVLCFCTATYFGYTRSDVCFLTAALILQLRLKQLNKTTANLYRVIYEDSSFPPSTFSDAKIQLPLTSCEEWDNSVIDLAAPSAVEEGEDSCVTEEQRQGEDSSEN